MQDLVTYDEFFSAYRITISISSIVYGDILEPTISRLKSASFLVAKYYSSYIFYHPNLLEVFMESFVVYSVILFDFFYWL